MKYIFATILIVSFACCNAQANDDISHYHTSTNSNNQTYTSPLFLGIDVESSNQDVLSDYLWPGTWSINSTEDIYQLKGINATSFILLDDVKQHFRKENHMIKTETLSTVTWNSWVSSPSKKYILLSYRNNSAKTGLYYIYDTSADELVPIIVENARELIEAQWSEHDYDSLMIGYKENLYFLSNIGLYIEEFKNGRRASSGSSILQLTNESNKGKYSHQESFSNDDKMLDIGYTSKYGLAEDGNHIIISINFDDSKVEPIPILNYSTTIISNSTRKLLPDIPKVTNISRSLPGRVIPKYEHKVLMFNKSTQFKSELKLELPVELPQQQYIPSSNKRIDNRYFVIYLASRQHNTMWVLICEIDVNHKELACLVSTKYEVKSGWLEVDGNSAAGYNSTHYLLIKPEFVDDKFGDSKHISLVSIDTKGTNGSEITQLTNGRIHVLKISYVNLKTNSIYFVATGVNAPAERHLYKVDIETKSVECITCNFQDIDCKNFNVRFSPSGRHYALACLGPKVPSFYFGRTRDHQIVRKLDANKEWRLKYETDKQIPISIFFDVEIEDFPAHVHLYLPPLPSHVERDAIDYLEKSNASIEDKIQFYKNQLIRGNSQYNLLPMLVEVYGGPQFQTVNFNFDLISSNHVFFNGRSFIYVKIDGRGTGFGGSRRAFTMFHKLGGPEIDDQISVTTKLVDILNPIVDKRKVGIWGWSYGGYAAGMVLARSASQAKVNGTERLFKCAASGAPVTDWRLYTSHAYVERYMSSPFKNEKYDVYEKDDHFGNDTAIDPLDDVNQRYIDSSLILKAGDIPQNSYLILHGTSDDIVHIQHSMLLSQALTQEGILHKTQLYINEKHTVESQDHKIVALADFFETCFGMKSE